MKTFISITFFLISLTFAGFSQSETRFFVNKDYPSLTVKNNEGVVVLSRDITYPFYLSNENYSLDSSGYPYVYEFKDDVEGSQIYRIDENQDPVFYVYGSISRHYTRMPHVVDGTVTIENPDTGEVYFETQTKGDGGFEVISSQIESYGTDMVRINVKGGVIRGRERDDSNVLTALVRTDSFKRGSVTVSISSTAAFLALEEHKSKMYEVDYYEVYKQNMRLVARGMMQPTSEHIYETAYLNPENAPLVNVFSVDMREFMTRKIVSTDLVLMELMLVDREQQEKGLSLYFQVEGWGIISKGWLTGRSVDIRLTGLAELFIQKFTYDSSDSLKKTIVYEDEFINNDNHHDEITLPTIMVKDGEFLSIVVKLQDGWDTFIMYGCIEKSNLRCVVDERANRVDLGTYKVPVETSEVNTSR
jgi:hypothetical protein